jgi:hypothetical protein
MKRIPYREYLMYMAWREQQWEKPSRTDNYIMSLTNVVQGIFGKVEATLENFKLKFVPTTKPIDPTIKSKAYIEDRKREAAAKARQPGRPGPRPGM